MLVKTNFEGPKFMMGKDERKEKNPCKKDIDLEYSTWPWVDYKFYDVNFFEKVKKLLAKGMDPNPNY